MELIIINFLFKSNEILDTCAILIPGIYVCRGVKCDRIWALTSYATGPVVYTLSQLFHYLEMIKCVVVTFDAKRNAYSIPEGARPAQA